MVIPLSDFPHLCTAFLKHCFSDRWVLYHLPHQSTNTSCKRVCLCVFVCVECSIDHTCEVRISSYLIPHMHNFASVLKIFTYFKRDVSMLLLWSTLLLHSFTSQLTHSTLHPVVFQKALTCNAYVTLLDIQI